MVRTRAWEALSESCLMAVISTVCAVSLRERVWIPRLAPNSLQPRLVLTHDSRSQTSSTVLFNRHVIIIVCGVLCVRAHVGDRWAPCGVGFLLLLREQQECIQVQASPGSPCRHFYLLSQPAKPKPCFFKEQFCFSLFNKNAISMITLFKTFVYKNTSPVIQLAL